MKIFKSYTPQIDIKSLVSNQNRRRWQFYIFSRRVTLYAASFLLKIRDCKFYNLGSQFKMYDSDAYLSIVIKIVKVFKIFVLDLRAYSTYGPNMHFLDGEQRFHLEDFQFFRMHYFRFQIRFYCML